VKRLREHARVLGVWTRELGVRARELPVRACALGVRACDLLRVRRRSVARGACAR
jgi:hypothetical protein